MGSIATNTDIRLGSGRAVGNSGHFLLTSPKPKQMSVLVVTRLETVYAATSPLSTIALEISRQLTAFEAHLDAS